MRVGAGVVSTTAANPADPTAALRAALQQVRSGGALERAQAGDIFSAIMAGSVDPILVAALLAMLATRLPSVGELAGAADVLRGQMIRIAAPPDAIDTCGTGGVTSKLFNVSTAAGIVAAAAGATVVKHGNRAITSRSGSSDVLTALGVKIHAGPAQQQSCLNHARIAFAFAAAHHPAFKQVAPIRQMLGIPTIFNLLAPLINPGGVRRQLVGVASPVIAERMVAALAELGAVRALVINGTDPERGAMCEISITGPTHFSRLDDGVRSVETFSPPNGLSDGATIAALEIASPIESAAVIRAVISGEDRGPARAMVLVNAGAALWVAGRVKNIGDGIELAGTTIDRGAAKETLGQLIHFSHAAAG